MHRGESREVRSSKRLFHLFVAPYWSTDSSHLLMTPDREATPHLESYGLLLSTNMFNSVAIVSSFHIKITMWYSIFRQPLRYTRSTVPPVIHDVESSSAILKMA